MVVNMQCSTQLEQHLSSGDFKAAREVFQNWLRDGSVINPTTDELWAPFALKVAREEQKRNGCMAAVAFWDSLLDFFTSDLEKKWGFCHKGTIYFQKGILTFGDDLGDAIKHFRLAYEQDLQTEKLRGGSNQEVRNRCSNYDAHTMLAIASRINEWPLLETESDRKFFLEVLLGPALQATLEGRFTLPGIVEEALRKLSVKDDYLTCSAYSELIRVSSIPLTTATISLSGVVLESLLLDILHNGKGVQRIGSRSVFDVELGPLHKEAVEKGIFPCRSIEAATKLIHHMRNRLHPGNELQQDFCLTPRVGVTTKNFLDVTLIRWSEIGP